ncbi:PH domain-containing protein [Pseudodesulfovibrio senegalensis]|jgi:hypothetical protein|uniref:PH domain-containing protein n=1 Tax=Pseudodesulfovibrio senegalensis TaxID=1721087 RepID=A0A6N6N6A0_9BACT|nr:PH domain-containing protein [Pseudodesulfovibrio senegalensis]KAB1443009.1 PH domain-containing protein [Pseudodesulfovibrio senegalensis]
MGFLDGLMGNASEINAEDMQEELAPILGDAERVQRVFKVIRDLFVFTDKRLMFIDKQGITGKKVDYLSVPYRAITVFSVETAGHFDLDAELKIWISGRHEPLIKELKSGTDVVGVQKMLANYVAR